MTPNNSHNSNGQLLTNRELVQFPSETDADDVGVRLVELFAELEDCDPTELPSLQEAVDGDVLNTLLTEASDDRYLKVEFSYNDTLVSITNTGRISIHPLSR